MPGVELEGQDGRRYLGRLKLQLGPINLTYRGQAWFEEVDPEARSFRMVATGSETGGAGQASAVLTGVVSPNGDGSSEVEVDVELQLAGRPAQFGRGILIDVSRQLTSEFASRLAAQIAPDTPREMLSSVEDDSAVPVLSLIPERWRLWGIGVAGAVGGLLVGWLTGRRGARRRLSRGGV